ncbi:unnamed protein product, partial [Mesorhabditis spiculigera]
MLDNLAKDERPPIQKYVLQILGQLTDNKEDCALLGAVLVLSIPFTAEEAQASVSLDVFGKSKAPFRQRVA